MPLYIRVPFFSPGNYSTTRPCRPKVRTASQESSHNRCRGLQMPPALDCRAQFALFPIDPNADEVVVVAGGQSLVPMMAMRLVRPAWLVDINEIAELKFIAVEKDMARTGACTRQCVIERDQALAAKVPLLAQALSWVGHVQTRNRGTVGGSLAHADPCAELPLVAHVLGAKIGLRSGKGARALDAAKFFAGPMMTAMRPDECL